MGLRGFRPPSAIAAIVLFGTSVLWEIPIGYDDEWIQSRFGGPGRMERF
jgi:hypothetical protein